MYVFMPLPWKLPHTGKLLHIKGEDVHSASDSESRLNCKKGFFKWKQPDTSADVAARKANPENARTTQYPECLASPQDPGALKTT